MACTYDTATDVGTLRLLFGDTDCAAPIFQDAEWERFLSFGGGSHLRAKGHALLAVASNRNLLILVIKTLGFETDGASTAREFRLQAKEAFEQADVIDAQSGGLFDWAEMVTGPFSARERLDAEILRSGV